MHKYSANYADMARPLSNLFKKDVDWCWGNTEHDAFQAVKESILHAPILALPDSIGLSVLSVTLRILP